jgi:hypothetical protein
MKARVIAALAALALTAAFALPALAAPSTTVSYNFNVREYDSLTAGEYQGRMRIRFSPDGIVYGTFLNSEGQVSSVTGGLHGTKIWLQIGNGSFIGRRYFNGTLIDGKIKALAPPTSVFHLWNLEATPISR